MKTSPTAEPSRASALLIGCGAVDDPGITNLAAPAHDVSALGSVLRDNEYRVTCLIDCTVQQARDAVHKLLSGAGKRDTCLLYMSCHGALDAQDQLHFLLRDTRGTDLGPTALSASWLREQIASCAAGVVFVILDCCHSGAFIRPLIVKGLRGQSSDEIAAAIEDNLRDLVPVSVADSSEPTAARHSRRGSGRAALTSSSLNEVSFEDPEKELSYFTAAVVDGLSGAAAVPGSSEITFDHLNAYVSREFANHRVKQKPLCYFHGSGVLPIARVPTTWQQPQAPWQSPPPPSVVATPSDDDLDSPLSPAARRWGFTAAAVAFALISLTAYALTRDDSPGTTSAPDRSTPSVQGSSASTAPSCTGDASQGWAVANGRVSVTIAPLGRRYSDRDNLSTTVSVHNLTATALDGMALGARDQSNHSLPVKNWAGHRPGKSTSTSKITIKPYSTYTATTALHLTFHDSRWPRAVQELTCDITVPALTPKPKPTFLKGSWSASGQGMRMTVERVEYTTLDTPLQQGPGIQLTVAFTNSGSGTVTATELQITDQSGYVVYRSGLPVFENVAPGQTLRAPVAFLRAGTATSLNVTFSGIIAGAFGGPTSQYSFRVPLP
ncbi:caspase family protein [Streptomyces collinus]|uniref:caspase family protein n=1 Tax=Streptomyces collinus TaxID=42684 RepID=UPI00332FA1F7